MGERAALQVLYDGWATYQDKLVAAVAPLTDDQLALRAAAHLRSVGELLTHIVGVRAGWFHFDLGMGGDEWREVAEWQDPAAAPRSAAELREGLASTWRFVRDSLATWGPDDLGETIHSRWPAPGEEELTYVRGWIVYHVLEHDIHHGGELGFVLGMHGLPGPDI